MSFATTLLAVCCMLVTTLATKDKGRRMKDESRNANSSFSLQPSSLPTAPHFQTVDVFIDTGEKPLAAYQFSLRSLSGNALLSGIAGADHPAFAKPPYYDPKALIDERIVIAALSTDESLPSGRTRVARLTVQVSGGEDPRYELTLQAAAGPDGNPVPAKVTVEAKER
jgi:hypothetical protein